MFCLNSKKEEKKEEKKIEKFENITDYLPYLMVGLIVFLITFFCIYYFNKVSPTKTSTAIAKLSSQNTQSSLPLLNPQTTKSIPVKNTKYLPISNIKSFGPDDIISPLLTSSSENTF